MVPSASPSMAAAILRPIPISNPNPNPRFPLPLSPHLRLRLRHVTPLRLTHRRRLLIAAVNDDSNNLSVDNADEPDDVDQVNAEETWKHALEAFKEEALKLKEKSTVEAGRMKEVYGVYSEKAMVALLEISEKLKIQGEKARYDMSVLSKEIGEEGKVYLESVAKNSPEEVRDIVEEFGKVDELKHISVVRDYYVGIPFGGLLAIGGFLSFMLTGSVDGIRFGIILGGSLLALSVLSLRSWKKGVHSQRLLKGQAMIATILFFEEWRALDRVHSFPTLLKTLVSGAVLAFYIYRVVVDGKGKGSSAEQASE